MVKQLFSPLPPSLFPPVLLSHSWPIGPLWQEIFLQGWEYGPDFLTHQQLVWAETCGGAENGPIAH